jgi:hypothetical protein
MKPDVTLETHLSEYKLLAWKLDAADCKIIEDLKIFRLMRSLPSQFDTFVASTIINCGESMNMSLEEAI